MAGDIPIDVISIPKGTVFEKSWPLTDADTGAMADPTGWSARCEVKDAYGGNLITSFHSDRVGHSGWPGVISFDAAANLTLFLSATNTAGLPVMKNGVFDVELIDPSGNPFRLVQGRAHVTPEATTDV